MRNTLKAKKLKLPEHQGRHKRTGWLGTLQGLGYTSLSWAVPSLNLHDNARDHSSLSWVFRVVANGEDCKDLESVVFGSK